MLDIQTKTKKKEITRHKLDVNKNLNKYRKRVIIGRIIFVNIGKNGKNYQNFLRWVIM